MRLSVAGGVRNFLVERIKKCSECFDAENNYKTDPACLPQEIYMDDPS